MPQGIVAVTGGEFSFRPDAAGRNQSVIGIVAIVLLMQTVTTLNQIAARVITKEQVLPLAEPGIAVGSHQMQQGKLYQCSA
jgi:hypothetical protein